MTDPLYKGEPLDAARGPGLGCFWAQVLVLAVLLVVTPLGVIAGWPTWLTGGLLIVTLILLLFAGQTVIFLLRLVAADRRTRRRPRAPTAGPTVGDIEAGLPDADEAWLPLQVPASLEPLFQDAESAARNLLESNGEFAPFAMTEDHAGSRSLLQRVAGAGDTPGSDRDPSAVTIRALRSVAANLRATAFVVDARIRLPGLRRPTDAIRIDLEAAHEPAARTVAIRYESEGGHRYRYWEPVMSERSTVVFASPPEGRVVDGDGDGAQRITSSFAPPDEAAR